VPVTFDGEDAFLSALVGYQFRPGRLIVKLFASRPRISISSRTTHITRCKAVNWASGCRPRPGSTSRPAFFSPPTPAYGTAFQEYCSLARLGLRVRPRLSLGLEGGALGNEEYDAGRAGGFVRLNLRDTEVTVSGGFTGNYRRHPEWPCSSRRLSNVLRFATVRLGPIFRLRQGALPAPPRQCLVLSPARLKLEPVIPARQGGIARLAVHPV
jgi:hypothetical protein